MFCVFSLQGTFYWRDWTINPVFEKNCPIEGMLSGFNGLFGLFWTIFALKGLKLSKIWRFLDNYKGKMAGIVQKRVQRTSKWWSGAENWIIFRDFAGNCPKWVSRQLVFAVQSGENHAK